MANTYLGQRAMGQLRAHLFFISSAAGATETLQMPVLNKGTTYAAGPPQTGPTAIQIFGCSIVFTSATGRAATFAYKAASSDDTNCGQLIVGGLTASDVAYVTVLTP